MGRFPCLQVDFYQVRWMAPQMLQATRLTDWLGKVFTALPMLAAAGALTVSLMSSVNFMLHSNFKRLLVGPAHRWALTVALHGAARCGPERPPGEGRRPEVTYASKAPQSLDCQVRHHPCSTPACSLPSTPQYTRITCILDANQGLPCTDD